MVKVDNTYVFEDDDEFYNYVVVPKVYIKESEVTNSKYCAMELTKFYKDAVKNGEEFYIADPESKVMKREVVQLGPCQASLKNINPFFGHDMARKKKFESKECR